MILDEAAANGSIRIATVPVPAGSATTKVLLDSSYTNRLVEISNDGKWIAYTSTESGRVEVYVRPFPGGRYAVSNAGGDQVLWNPNGRELFYRDGVKIISALISTSPTFSVLSRTPLFDDSYDPAGTLNWDVFPDGNRFAMTKPVESNTQLTVTVGWTGYLPGAVKP